MTPDDVHRFLARFTRFGAEPGRETYLALFHPEATLFDSGMERPIGVPEIPEHIEGILRLVPDFRMVPERWRHRDGTVFVEARNRASLGGAGVHWRSVYVIDLRGDLVIRGRRYYDRRPLFARLAGGLPDLPTFEPAASGDAPPVADPFGSSEAWLEAWCDRRKRGATDELAAAFREDGALHGPGASRPLGRAEIAGYLRWIEGLVPDLRLELEKVAAADDLVFLEWKARGAKVGRPLSFGLVERFDLAAGLALSARLHFDTLALATALGAP